MGTLWIYKYAKLKKNSIGNFWENFSLRLLSDYKNEIGEKEQKQK